jgi:citronellol/citronellal dehydrogenase
MGVGILDGKVAIVTGASRGIGAEIARRFGAAGAAVAVAARTTEAGTSPLPGTIAETAEQIRAAGGTAVAIRADLSKPQDRERLVSEAGRQLGPPDILVSNAAVTYFTRVTDFTARRYQLMFAALMLCRAEPTALTGRIAYSQDLLAELGVSAPARR